MEYRKRMIAYGEYGSLMATLSNKIEMAKLDIKFIYTIMRGGLPIAVHLSHRFDLPVYTDERYIDFTNVKEHSVLIVDDIVDTGKTLDYFKDTQYIASLFYKPRASFIPNFYAQECKDYEWIVFPWETYDEKENR